jgi:hypothetical protein
MDAEAVRLASAFASSAASGPGRQIAANGTVKLRYLNRRPRPAEIEAAFLAARRAGLWRFDERRPHPLLRWN